MTTEPRTTSVPATPSLVSQLTWWVLVMPAAMIVALAAQNTFLLNYTHGLSGVLWTGADLAAGGAETGFAGEGDAMLILAAGAEIAGIVAIRVTAKHHALNDVSDVSLLIAGDFVGQT